MPCHHNLETYLQDYRSAATERLGSFPGQVSGHPDRKSELQEIAMGELRNIQRETVADIGHCASTVQPSCPVPVGAPTFRVLSYRLARQIHVRKFAKSAGSRQPNSVKAR